MANRVYEVMYIAEPTTDDETITQLNEAIGKVVSDGGGEIVRTDVMGVRKLAYPIKKRNDGYYVLFEIEGSGQEIAELERRMRVNDLIMRYLTVRVDEERKTAAKITAKREQKRNRGGNSLNNADSSDNRAEENIEGGEE